MASLAQWAAKGAHLLELDLLLTPGERLRLDAPLSWPSVAVAYAAWWAGVALDLTADEAPVVVRHESRPTSVDGEVLLLGDALDGSPLQDHSDEPWVRAVQTFPDQPPAPRASGSTLALRTAERELDQAGLLAAAEALAPEAGTVGVDETTDPLTAFIAATVRPLVRARPTVVLREGVSRDAAAGDRVADWL